MVKNIAALAKPELSSSDMAGNGHHYALDIGTLPPPPIAQSGEVENVMQYRRLDGTLVTRELLPDGTEVSRELHPDGTSVTKEHPALMDYEMQLRMLEQQNKQRLVAARYNADNRSNAQGSSHGLPDRPPALTPGMSTLDADQVMGHRETPTTSAAHWADYVPRGSNPNEALQSYQMELMLAEQQAKRRDELGLPRQQTQDRGYSEWAGASMPHRFPVGVQATGPATYQRDGSIYAGPARDWTVHDGRLYTFDVDKSLGSDVGTEGPASTALPLRNRSSSAKEEEEKKREVRGYQQRLQELKKQGKIRCSLPNRSHLESPHDVESGSLALDSVPDAEPTKSHKKSTKGKKASDGRQKAPKASKTLFDDYVHTPPIRATHAAASVYCKPFCDFMTNNPTVFHAVETQRQQLLDAGWSELDERDKWDIMPGGNYFTVRNGSAMIAFTVGEKYEPGNGCAIIAGHVDALTAKLKPVSEVPNKAGYLQLGVAPYAGGMNSTWWDRDLGIGGRVLVKEDDKIVTRLVKLDWPIARIPTLAPHFGAVANGPFNQETQMVPIIGLEGTETSATDIQVTKAFSQPSLLGGEGGPVDNFVNTQPPALVKVIGNALGLTASTYANMIGWELELFDTQPATTGGLNKEFIFAGRLDDKLCSWSAMQALISSQERGESQDSSIIKMVGWFDNEEIGSQLRQGAKSNYLPLTIERAVGSLAKAKGKKSGPNLFGRTYANSFLVSSDVTHAVNPNFLNAYMENHAPHLNVGLSVHADPNGHMTTDAISTAILQRCADSAGAKLQVFQIRNDSRSGGTVGPMLSSLTGIRAIDAGVAQLSMHSIRATTGALDPGLAVITYMAFLNRFESVDREFRK